MSTDPKDLAHDIAKRAPHEILAKYAVVLTFFICILLYGGGRVYYSVIDGALTALSDRTTQLETYQYCNELRFAAGAKNQCGVFR